MFGLGHVELLIVGAVVLVLFGHRLPELARTFGKTLRIFKNEVNSSIDE